MYDDDKEIEKVGRWAVVVSFFAIFVGGLKAFFIVFIIIFLAYFGYKYYDENKYAWEREREEQEDRKRKAEKDRKEFEKTKKLEKVNQENSIKITNESTQKKLHAYLSSILENISNNTPDIKPEDNTILMLAINDSIDNILLDDIPYANFLSRTVQSEKKTIFELIAQHNLEHHLVFKRLKNVFALSEQAENSSDTGCKILQRRINEIFRYVMDMPANQEKDNQLLERMISSTITEILQDYEIKEFYYQNSFVQSDLNLVLEHLEKHNFSVLPSVIRLKNLFIG